MIKKLAILRLLLFHDYFLNIYLDNIFLLLFENINNDFFFFFDEHMNNSKKVLN